MNFDRKVNFVVIQDLGSFQSKTGTSYKVILEDAKKHKYVVFYKLTDVIDKKVLQPGDLITSYLTINNTVSANNYNNTYYNLSKIQIEPKDNDGNEDISSTNNNDIDDEMPAWMKMVLEEPSDLPESYMASNDKIEEDKEELPNTRIQSSNKNVEDDGEL